MTPADEQALAAFADRVYPTLDQKNYYQLLSVTPGADAAAVRAAYYKVAAQLHPDRFARLPDTRVRDRLESIYARITEAYRVLSHREHRARYDQGLAAGQNRLGPPKKEPTGPKNPEESLAHPEAKKFFRLAMICLGKKDWKGAIMNFNFARAYEPNAPVLLAKLAEAQAAQKAGPAGPTK
jgi:curved DNA-binding protein CbpA